MGAELRFSIVSISGRNALAGGNEINATQVSIGETALVKEVRLEAQERRRLMDLGFLPGAKIERILDAPLGGTIAFRIRGTVVALRDTQTDRIEVEPCKS
jgi:Fe2+ transport system protein FeoA